ncbi:MAG: hypothetical protein IJC27_08735 [Lentisphaeria bacterium]|nr:hypothetical protein [Lentisphaeria bacterium]
MKKFFHLIISAASICALHAAELWENDLPAALAMYSAGGAASAPVIEEDSYTFATKNGLAIIVRKNVDFSAENSSLSLRIKAPVGSRAIQCYFTTDTDPKFAENKKISIYYSGNGKWQTVTAECAKNPNWKGKITGLRFDFSAPAGQKFYFKEAKFSSKFDLPAQWHFGAEGARAWNWRAALSAPAKIVNGAMQLNFAKSYSMAPAIPVYMDCAKYTTLTIRVKTNKPGRVGGVLYFKTEADPKLSEKQKIIFAFNADKEYQEVRINLAGSASWKGVVTEIRMDLSASAAPCTLEISDIIFSAKNNLAGLTNYGKSFGPFRDLAPEGGFEYSFYCNSPAQGELRIEDAFGKNILNTPLRLTGGKNSGTFNIPGNGAAVFFSFDAPVQQFTISPLPQEKQDNWSASWIADELNFKLKSHQYFQKEIILSDTPLDCRFQGTADDRLDLYINGKKVILPENTWQKPRSADVTNFFRKGSNLVAFHLENNGEASGLLANFAILTADGKITKVDTDSSFRNIRNPKEDWKDRVYSLNETFAPKVIGPYDVPPWGNWCLMPYEIFAERDQFSVKNITLVPIKGGVQIEAELTAEALRKPLDKITARAVAANVVIAEEDIILPRTVNKGDTVKIKQNLFAGKLLKDTYTLQLSGDDTHTITEKDLDFTVTENPDLRPNITSEVRQTACGPMIYINGKAFDDMIFYSAILDRMKEHYDAGYRFFMVGIGTNVGKGLTTAAWKESGYDFTTVTRNLNRITAAFPEIKMILSFGIDAPYWWHKKYPGEAIYLDGKSTHENLASPASEQWKKDGADFIRATIRHFENSPLRHHIAGYRLSSMCDGGEWQYPGVWANPQRHADFSPVMRKYFREFLKKKHGDSYDTSNVKVPSGKERRLPSATWFRDPAKEQLVIDYIECQSDAVATAAIHFLKAAKAEAKNKIVGIYGGYLLFYSGFPVQTIGHLAFRKVYESGAADFFSGPIDYHLRKLGLPGGNMASISSLKLHGATYFQENDTRTFLNRSPSHRHVNNLYESASVLLRDSAIGLVTSTPIYTCDLTGNSYRNQGLLDTGKILLDAFKKDFAPAEVRKPEVALLYSIDSLPYLIEKNQEITNASSYLLRISTGKSGAMTDAYLLEDIQLDKFPVSQYKCFVIVNGFYLKPEIRKAIEEKLCKNGATVVFTPGAGIFKDNKLSAENMKALTGFDFQPTGKKMPFAPVDMGNKPYVEKKYPDCRKIYLSTTELTPALYREIFRSAGVHIWMESDDTINTNGVTAFIHADQGGEKTVNLPFAASSVTDIISGKKLPLSNNGKSFKVNLKKYETRLYKFEE